jgi:hypothetical protein
VELEEARSLLGVSPDEEWEAVRVAYRRLIRLQHPDRAGPGATVRAAELNEAYRVLSRSLQVQTVEGRRPRRRVVTPPPPRFDAHIEGADTLIVEAPPDEAFTQLLEAGHVVGAVSYVDRSCAIFEVVVKHQGETCSFVVSLEGDDKTEAYCTLESMERSQRLSPTPIVRQLAGALRTPWVSPMDLDLDPDPGPDAPAESEAEAGEPPGEPAPAVRTGGLTGEVASEMTEDDATVRVVHRSPPPPPPPPAPDVDGGSASGIPDWQGGLPGDRPGNGNGARHSSANGNGSGGHG